MTDEEWRHVAGHPYEVSSHGRVRRADPGRGAIAGRILKPKTRRVGYLFVPLGRGCCADVHALVAAAFVGPRPEGYQVNHKDGDKTNNHADNLEYLTRKENMQHAIQHRLACIGEKNSSAKLTPELVLEVRRLRTLGLTEPAIAAQVGVSRSAINNILRRQTWTHI